MARRILVVEDDDEIRDGVVVLLRRAGYQVEAFDSGARALEYLDEGHRPDLILLDLLLRPDMNGWQFIVELRQLPRYQHVPVVAMTAAPLGKNQLREAQADAVLHKPFDFQGLISVVGKFVEPAGHEP